MGDEKFAFLCSVVVALMLCWQILKSQFLSYAEVCRVLKLVLRSFRIHMILVLRLGTTLVEDLSIQWFWLLV